MNYYENFIKKTLLMRSSHRFDGFLLTKYFYFINEMILNSECRHEQEHCVNFAYFCYKQLDK
jgi:hypothetical protein